MGNKKLNRSVDNLAIALRDVITEATDEVKDNIRDKINTKYFTNEIGQVSIGIKSRKTNIA